MEPPEKPPTPPQKKEDRPRLLGEDDFDLSSPGVVEERRGSSLGNMRVRIVRPRNLEFRRVKAGELEATEIADIPKNGLQRATYLAKRFLIGVPIATAMAENERLSKFKALAMLSSDAISSVAFASEAILINLVAAGSVHLGLTLPISLVIIVLLTVVAISYRQTIPPPIPMAVDLTRWPARISASYPAWSPPPL